MILEYMSAVNETKVHLDNSHKLLRRIDMKLCLGRLR